MGRAAQALDSRLIRVNLARLGITAVGDYRWRSIASGRPAATHGIGAGIVILIRRLAIGRAPIDLAETYAITVCRRNGRGTAIPRSRKPNAGDKAESRLVPSKPNFVDAIRVIDAPHLRKRIEAEKANHARVQRRRKRRTPHFIGHHKIEFIGPSANAAPLPTGHGPCAAPSSGAQSLHC